MPTPLLAQKHPRQSRSLLLGLLFCLSISIHPARMWAETISLGSLEWPPFCSSILPENGVTVQQVKAVCVRARLNVEITFLPWKRVLSYARTGIVDGFFPEYKTVEREQEFYFSQPVGQSVVGFVYLANRPFVWNSINELEGNEIAVVDGYINTESFDGLVKSGQLHIVTCRDDSAALLMVLKGRATLAVMDQKVYEFLINNSYPQYKTKLAFSSHLLQPQPLYVCFPKTPHGEQLAQRFISAQKSLSELPEDISNGTEEKHNQ